MLRAVKAQGDRLLDVVPHRVVPLDLRDPLNPWDPPDHHGHVRARLRAVQTGLDRVFVHIGVWDGYVRTLSAVTAYTQHLENDNNYYTNLGLTESLPSYTLLSNIRVSGSTVLLAKPSTRSYLTSGS